MKPQWKKAVLISAITVAITVCLTIGLFGAVKLIKKIVLGDPQNVFEEIYYIQVYYSNRMAKGFYIDIDHGFKQKWYEYNGIILCTARYEEQNERIITIQIDCHRLPSKKLVMSFYCGPSLMCSVSYNMETKTLTSEYTDCSFLYEILLPAWFDGMGERSNFSIDDLGDFIDKT